MCFPDIIQTTEWSSSKCGQCQSLISLRFSGAYFQISSISPKHHIPLKISSGHYLHWILRPRKPPDAKMRKGRTSTQVSSPESLKNWWKPFGQLRFLSLRRIVLCSGHPRGLSAPSRKKVQTVGTHFIMTYTNPHQIRVRVHYKFQYKTSLIFTASHTSY